MDRWKYFSTPDSMNGYHDLETGLSRDIDRTYLERSNPAALSEPFDGVVACSVSFAKRNLGTISVSPRHIFTTEYKDFVRR